MPTYEYVCTSCDNKFEIFQSIKDEPLKTCSKCGSEVKRLIGSGAGIIFKGSGFYVTDYKNNGNGKKGNSSTKEPSCASCTSDSCSAELD
ncbi:MAG: zinc ribbon domain-containing protein [Spirochaetes bacterium]|nr:zinc ribbon domain-containing protein [Spirochaetota bacterium]